MKKILAVTMAMACLAVYATVGFAAPKDYDFTATGDKGKVVFSHAKHLEKLGNRCPECHPKTFQMKKGGGADGMTMASMKEGKGCGHCHDGKTAFSAADDANCGKCHTAK